MAASYGANASVLDWRDRPVCSGCGGRNVDMVVTGPNGDSFECRGARHPSLNLTPRSSTWRRPTQSMSSNAATDQRVALDRASVLRVSAVSPAAVPAAHPATSPEWRAATGYVETTDSDRRRSLGSES